MYSQNVYGAKYLFLEIQQVLFMMVYAYDFDLYIIKAFHWWKTTCAICANLPPINSAGQAAFGLALLRFSTFKLGHSICLSWDEFEKNVKAIESLETTRKRAHCFRQLKEETGHCTTFQATLSGALPQGRPQYWISVTPAGHGTWLQISNTLEKNIYIYIVQKKDTGLVGDPWKKHLGSGSVGPTITFDYLELREVAVWD